MGAETRLSSVKGHSMRIAVSASSVKVTAQSNDKEVYTELTATRDHDPSSVLSKISWATLAASLYKTRQYAFPPGPLAYHLHR